MEPLLATASKKLPLPFPLYASPKIDGVRAWSPEGVLLSRQMKPFANHAVADLFGSSAYKYFDGEFAIGSRVAPDLCRKTAGLLNSKAGSIEGITFLLFDDLSIGPDAPFRKRLEVLRARAEGLPNCEVVEQVLVVNDAELRAYEEKCLAEGYEGIMVRLPSAPYKFGRSTEKEAILLKVKRFEDCEARILDSYELMHNMNEATEDERGFTKRSGHQENKVGSGMLGGVDVVGINGTYKGVEFSVGGGWTKAERIDLWANRDALPGQVITVKYFPTGSKDKPRFPVCKCFRDMAGA